MRTHGPLRPEVQLDIELSVICSRAKHTTDPAPVIEALRTTAGDRTDLLLKSVGSWAGYYEGDHPVLCAALRDAFPDAERWGRDRSSAPSRPREQHRRVPGTVAGTAAKPELDGTVALWITWTSGC